MTIRAGWVYWVGLDVSLHVYGRPGSDEIVIRRTIAKFGLGERVKICGEILPYEKNKVYRRHNCYIQLSAHEGMAMSVVEAMQHGMLCVVTPVGEIPNYTSDGENAVLMDVVGGVISEYSLRNLLAVLNDRQSCEAISSAAHRRFKNAPVFADSLVEALRKF